MTGEVFANDTKMSTLSEINDQGVSQAGRKIVVLRKLGQIVPAVTLQAIGLLRPWDKRALRMLMLFKTQQAGNHEPTSEAAIQLMWHRNQTDSEVEVAVLVLQLLIRTTTLVRMPDQMQRESVAQDLFLGSAPRFVAVPTGLPAYYKRAGRYVFQNRSMVSAADFPWNARLPESISYRMVPKAKMSARWSVASPLTCSGDI